LGEAEGATGFLEIIEECGKERQLLGKNRPGEVGQKSDVGRVHDGS